MHINVLPVEEPVEARPAIPGEKICFLVQVEDLSPGDGPISLDVSSTGAKVTSQLPAIATDPFELWVIPDPTDVEVTATVTVTATRSATGSEEQYTERRSIVVMPWQDDRAAEAQPYFDRWVGWLAESQPDLGITAETEWDSTFVSALLIVSKYAYWSDEWEMVVAWHIMVPPDDFTEVYLRRRGTETAYSYAFRQDSFSENTEPRAIEPPADLIR